MLALIVALGVFLATPSARAADRDDQGAANTPPVATEPYISRAGPTSIRPLQATYVYTDNENDPESGTRIWWLRDGSLVSEFTNQTFVPMEHFFRGEVWQFILLPSDGTDFGLPAASPERTIQNTPPEVYYLRWGELDIQDSDPLHILYTYVDRDGDLESGTEIRWWVDGVPQPHLDDLAVIPPEETDARETWSFRLRVSDGIEFTEPISPNDLWISPDVEHDRYQHSADTNFDFSIDLSELLRVVQLYNAATFSCAESPSDSEDGYLPGIGTTDCRSHAGDYNPQDFSFGLSELMRMVQIFNSAHYQYCPTIDPPREDNYCLIPF